MAATSAEAASEAASEASKLKLSGLARQLVNSKLLTEQAAAEAATEAKNLGQQFVSFLVEKKLASGEQISLVAQRAFSLPLLGLDSIDPGTLPIDLVNDQLITRHHILPLAKRGNRLYVGISDPTNQQALDEVKFQTGLATEGILVTEDKLAAMISSVLDQSAEIDGLLDEDLDNLDVEAGEESTSRGASASEAEETPVVRFVNKVLLDAINRGASDLHFEPYEKSYRVRFRTDGILATVATPPIAMSGRMAARIKIMSQLDIAERRLPQDGRIKLKITKNRSIDFRINTLPTLFGEKIVMRILDSSSAKLGIDILGYEEEQKKNFLDTLKRPQGLILVTGPTGSGKTVSLYTGLNILNTDEVNISTAEDPVEINLEGVNQVQMNNKVGLTFAAALRAFLRQDPDIIMVGEIRDLETAEIAIKVEQTGHMVLSTLHTNDAPQTVTRLMNMGVAPFNIASAVSLIIAQRLGRRLCTSCKVPETDIPREELLNWGFLENEVDELALYKAVGCEQCTKGYKGRVGIYQVVKMSDETGRIIMSGGTALDIGDQFEKEGYIDLRRAALNKAKMGLTSLEEVNRVTKE